MSNCTYEILSLKEAPIIDPLAVLLLISKVNSSKSDVTFPPKLECNCSKIASIFSVLIVTVFILLVIKIEILRL
ncbi:hypothetical protein D3C87_1259850 [compost metagenome]